MREVNVRSTLLVALLGLLLTACEGRIGSTDGSIDASVADSSVFDSGSVDANIMDASVFDAGSADASVADSGIDAGVPENPRKVFAHYMVAIRTYGADVDAYKRDIREAQGAGIDGFALNAGSWRNGNYATDIATLFQAANQLNSGFKLFFSIDMSGDFTAADIVAMMQMYAGNPAYLRKGTKPVLSTYAGEQGGVTTALPFWRDQVLGALRSQGIDCYFVPGFYLTGFALVTQPNLEADYQSWWHEIIDGYFYFGAAGLPSDAGPSLTLQNEAGAAVMHAHNKLFMASVTPQYWGGKQYNDGRRYFEFNGGEGLDNQWRSLMAVRSDWVELTTWNDFGEASYFTPCEDLSLYWNYEYVTARGFFKTHAGELALSKYFIDWFKRDAQPPITKDAFYWFYRTHPYTAVASNDPHIAVTEFHGTMTDSIFITTLLPTPAEVRVTTGSVVTTVTVAAGLQHTRFPFSAGMQHFELRRNNITVLEATGDPINMNPELYNFNYTTGSAIAP